jgi:hypothetical protein
MRATAIFRLACAVLFLSCAAAFCEDLESVSDVERNFVVTYTSEWKRLESKSPQIALMLQKNIDQIILIGAHETNVSLEAQISALKSEDGLSNRTIKEISRSEATVGGENAVTIVAKTKDANFSGFRYVTFVTHQGIAYRIVGVTAEDDLEFIADYNTFLTRFAFKADRTEWLEKNEGKPQPVALLGGLLTLELNQPRWQESTFEHKPDYRDLDKANFKLGSGSAWLSIAALRSTRTPAAELSELVRTVSALYKDNKPVTLAQTESARKFPVAANTAEYGGYKRYLRFTTLVEDGIAIRVWMEVILSRKEETEKDWQQLLRTLTLRRQSDPANPSAFALKKDTDHDFEYVKPSPALDAVLAAGNCVITADSSTNAVSFPPSGKSVLIASGTEKYLEDLASHLHTPVKGAFTSRSDVAWSPDSATLAWSGDGIHVLALAKSSEKLIKNNANAATQLAFSGDADLLVCAPVSTRGQTLYSRGARYFTRRLDKIKLADQSKTVLINFPFSKMDAVAVSPDSARIAVVSNRDAARTSAATHLYVCNADGSEMKQLTRGDEHFTALAWSADGASIYAFGSIQKIEGFAAAGYGRSDLYRIPAAGGDAVNLTRCARFSRAWFAADDVFLELNAYDVNAQRHGIYRVSIAALERATRDFEIPVPPDYDAVPAAVSAKVLAAVGGKDVIPDPTILAVCAQAFADAAAQSTHEAYDFSPASLDRFDALLQQLRSNKPVDRNFWLGAGAYYGETLRKCAGAEWKIKPQPFSQWLPMQEGHGNALVRVCLPFSSPLMQQLTDSENDSLESSQSIANRDAAPKIILVYPPSAAAEMLKSATPSEYSEAFKLLDIGEIDKAVDLLSKIMIDNPKNKRIAEEIINICEAAGLTDAAAKLARHAVDNGNEVPDLLIRCADDVLKSDPQQAQQFYRKATEAPWAPSDAYIKLGKMFAEQKRMDIACSCWRQGHAHGTPAQKIEISKLMHIPTAAGAGAGSDDSSDDGD